MGWRDINLNRRKPQLRVAVVPRAEGQDLREAVLQKACSAALGMLAQLPADATGAGSFIAGYLSGYARHQALKHGVDAEADELQALLGLLSASAPPGLTGDFEALRFLPRPGASARAKLMADRPEADAGYLVGHLESVCRSTRLLGQAVTGERAAGAEALLTACDVAADRMQTHEPTASLRFDAGERAILRAAFTRPSA